MLQKTFTEDFMTSKKNKNIAQRSKNYVKDSHPAIISAEVFDKVQEEMGKRTRLLSKGDGTIEISGTNLILNIFWEICSCVMTAEHLFGGERKEVR